MNTRLYLSVGLTKSKYLQGILIFLIAIIFIVFPKIIKAQSYSCFFQPISPALTDLGLNEYYRLTGNPGRATSTWTYVRQPGLIGGLYSNGLNVRPIAHENAGIALANQIQKLDNNGNPSTTGKVGMISLGMSNTSSEFSRFINLANADPDVNDDLVIVNGALSGGTTERWAYPNDSQYTAYWNNFNTKIAQAGLTHNQIQVVWVKITHISNRYNSWPAGMQLFQNELETIARDLKSRLPNLKITYFSTRTRSYIYFGGPADPSGFENAFAVRWMLEKQINGDPSLNYNPELGATPVSYMAWGPYLWIDGTNPRSDGRTWPSSNLINDCIHPSTLGNQAVAEMLMEFFKTDTTATPWFLNTPPPPPTPDIVDPLVSVTSPLSGTSVSGIVTVTANASDNRGLTGVQFLLDSQNLGLEDTTFPYSISWNTTSISNGDHLITAVARDMASNFATSTTVNVTVFNDLTPPSVPVNLSVVPVSTSQINLSWDASIDDSSVSHYIIYRCSGLSCAPTTQLATSTTTSYQNIGLSDSSFYTYSISAVDVNGNVSAQSIPVTTMTPLDTNIPLISNISVNNLTDSGITINWNTDELSNSQIEFINLCPQSGCLTTLISTLVINHSVNISGLLPNTTYSYVVRSADVNNNLAISSIQTFTTQNEVPPGSGNIPISAWGFGNDSVVDDVGGCIGCSKVGTTWFQPSIVSGAYNFNGNSYLNLGTFPYLNNKSNFTITLWVRPGFDQNSTAWNYAFSDGSNINIFYLGATRYWRGTVRTTVGTFHVSSPVISFNANTWHQIGLTYNGSIIKLYWDGNLVGTRVATGPVATDTGATYLGISPGGGGFLGAIDEFRVYDSVFSDTQVNQSFLNPSQY